MKEEVLHFGTRGHLLGVMSRPDRLDPSRPVLVMPNTGLDHRVGPNRLHVHLCRAVAEAGYPAIRIDLAGLGDSLPAPGGALNPQNDLLAAIQEIERRGLGSRFIAMGLCSGAFQAYHFMQKDARVAGAILIDSYTYPTRRYQRLLLRNKLIDVPRMARFVADRISRQPPPDTVIELDSSDKPSHGAAAEHFAAIVARAMPLCFVYTGGMPDNYNYRDQLFDGFPVLRSPKVELHYMKHADHTFTRWEMRRDLVQVLLNWLGRNFPLS